MRALQEQAHCFRPDTIFAAKNEAESCPDEELSGRVEHCDSKVLCQTAVLKHTHSPREVREQRSNRARCVFAGYEARRNQELTQSLVWVTNSGSIFPSTAFQR